MCLQKTMIVLQLMGMFRVCHRYFTCSFPRRNSPGRLRFLRVPFSGKTVYVWKMNSRTQVVLFACNEVAFTVLDVVEQQLRLNKIDANGSGRGNCRSQSIHYNGSQKRTGFSGKGTGVSTSQSSPESIGTMIWMSVPTPLGQW